MNRNNKFTQLIIEAAIEKGLQEISENKNQGINHLLQLGKNFSYESFSGKVINHLRQKLALPSSPYYALINDAVESIDHDIIKRFAVNLIHNSWQTGTNVIRQKENLLKCYIPWSLIFDLRKEVIHPITVKETDAIISQGEAIGIFSFLFFIEEGKHVSDKATELAAQHPESVFFFFLKPENITEKLVKQIRIVENIVISLDSADDTIQKPAISLLRENHLLYGAYTMVNNQNYQNVLSSQYQNKLSQLHYSYHMLIQEDAKANNKRRYSMYINTMKSANKYSLFIFDFYSDFAYIDSLVSASDCFLSIVSDGDIASGSLNNIVPSVNIRNQNLEAVLKKVYPKP